MLYDDLEVDLQESTFLCRALNEVFSSLVQQVLWRI